MAKAVRVRVSPTAPKLKKAFQRWKAFLFLSEDVAVQQAELHAKNFARSYKPRSSSLCRESHQAQQLIAHGVAFAVPNKQLFAPQIGMILSEHFSSEPRKEQDMLSPATQALLIWFLNHHPATMTWHPFDEAAALGYAGMSATRAIRELVQFDLFELEVRGRAKHLKLNDTRRNLWNKAKPH